MNTLIKTIRWQLITSKRQYITTTLGMVVGYFFLMGMLTGMTMGYSGGFSSHEDASLAGSLFSVSIFMSSFMIATVCDDLKEKPRRANYLMLPESIKIKFWSRIITVCVITFIGQMAAIAIADVLQMIISTIFSGEAQSFVKAIFHTMRVIRFDNFEFNGMEVSPFMAGVITISSILAGLSLFTSMFILGGFFYRRQAGILSFVSWLIIGITTSVTIYKIISWAFNDVIYFEVEFLTDARLLGWIAFLAVSIALTALNLRLSYLILKRMPLMSNKWINIF